MEEVRNGSRRVGQAKKRKVWPKGLKAVFLLEAYKKEDVIRVFADLQLRPPARRDRLRDLFAPPNRRGNKRRSPRLAGCSANHDNVGAGVSAPWRVEPLPRPLDICEPRAWRADLQSRLRKAERNEGIALPFMGRNNLMQVTCGRG